MSLMLGLSHRAELRGVSGWLEDEFDRFVAAIQTWGANVTTGALTATSFVLGGFTQPVTRIVKTAADFSVTSSTTIQNVTGLSHTVERGKTYAFEATLFMTAGAAGGYRLDVNGTCTASHVRYHLLVIADGGTVVLSEIESALGSNRGASTPTSVIGVIRGTVAVQIGGVLRIGFAQNGASGTPSVVTKHSRFTIQEIPS
jgi:hypothetical protein